MTEQAQTTGTARRRGVISRRALLLSASVSLAFARAAAQSQSADRRRIGVLYAPSERFAAILDATFAGISAAAPLWTLDRKPIRPGAAAAEMQGWLEADVSGWLLLGTEATQIVKGRRLSSPAVAGLQYLSPEDQAAAGGVSLDFDPEAVFPELSSLLPRHNRVHVIHLKGRDDWIIERLRQAGAMRGYSILPAAAQNLGEATDHFSGALRYGNPATDVIWVLGGSGLITRDTSAHLFQQAYNARFPVFAGRRAWVEEGAFLGGEPDFREHGAQLARVLERVLATKGPLFETTAKISLAMNVRVARRVGVAVTQNVRDRMGALIADD